MNKKSLVLFAFIRVICVMWYKCLIVKKKKRIVSACVSYIPYTCGWVSYIADQRFKVQWIIKFH